MVIEITKDECLCDEDSVQDYVDVLNGIVHECMLGNFREGYRNKIAVDLTVAAYMLGLDASKVLDWLIQEDVIDPCDDDEDTCRRVEAVLDYSRHFTWDYMIDPEAYARVAHNCHADQLPVEFRIS